MQEGSQSKKDSRVCNAKVSVIIPVYNAEKWITNCIDSVLNQTLPPSEIIIVNDGSKDRSIEIVREKYSFVRPLKMVHQSNKGLAAARNKGILESSEQFIAFLDADDVWLPGKICRQIGLLEAAGGAYGLCYTFAEQIDELGKIKKTWAEINLLGDYFGAYNEITSEALSHGNYVAGSGSSVLMRRKCIDKVGLFNEELELAEDWEYWYRLSLKYKVLTIPEVLVQIRTHRNSMQHVNKKRLYRKLPAIHSMMRVCPHEQYDNLRAAELATAVRILLFNIRNIPLVSKLLKEYGLLSLVVKSLQEIASWTKHHLKFCYKRILTAK